MEGVVRRERYQTAGPHISQPAVFSCSDSNQTWHTDIEERGTTVPEPTRGSPRENKTQIKGPFSSAGAISSSHSAFPPCWGICWAGQGEENCLARILQNLTIMTSGISSTALWRKVVVTFSFYEIIDLISRGMFWGTFKRMATILENLMVPAGKMGHCWSM